MNRIQTLFELLHAHHIDFVLIGGFAGVVYGSSLVTNDIDICCPLSSSYIDKLRTMLKDHRPKHRLTPQRLSFLTTPTDTTNVKNLYLETDLGSLDILSDVLGIGDFNKVKENSHEIQVYGHLCRLLTLDALILSKETLARPKDLASVLELKAIREKNT